MRPPIACANRCAPVPFVVSGPRFITYVESVYQKVLLGDIAARWGVRNVQALRVLMKKVAETVRGEASYTALEQGCGD